MSALRMIAWGMGQWDDADGPTRDRIHQHITKELGRHGLWHARGGTIWHLKQPSRRGSGGRDLCTGTLQDVCRHAMTVIDPKNYPTR
jgi:hypothetical protein